jgi:putative peptide zinc metalloprotease protein
VIFSNYNFIKTNYRNINILNIFSLFFLSKISGIWHELGHATACRKFNIEHGDIGFGFYLLMPVFFADVSNIWKLEPKKRIVVNLGGVYFDLMFATILLIIFLFSKNINLLLFPSLILIGILYNLNPFVRYDGYWILSDLLFIPSLQKKSYALLKTFFSNLLKFKIKKQTTKNCLLILYACISLNYILFILIAIFIFNTKSVLYLPVNLHNYINRLINGNDFVFNEFFEYTIPLIFYILILKFIIEIVKKKP